LEGLQVEHFVDPRSFSKGDETWNPEKRFKKLPFDPISIIITPAYENPVEILIQEDRR
jgi:hypothetical protein